MAVDLNRLTTYAGDLTKENNQRAPKLSKLLHGSLLLAHLSGNSHAGLKMSSWLQCLKSSWGSRSSMGLVGKIYWRVNLDCCKVSQSFFVLQVEQCIHRMEFSSQQSHLTQSFLKDESLFAQWSFVEDIREASIKWRDQSSWACVMVLLWASH